MAKIVVRFQNQTVSEHALRPGFNDIGRLSRNSIRIDHPGISRQHAFILGDGEGRVFVLEDLKSLNGTYVNKRRVQKHLLRPGDVVALGQHSLEFLEDPSGTADASGAADGPHLLEEASGRRHPLHKDTVYFGNSSADDIQVPGLMVGKNFASLNRKGGGWVANLLVKRFSQLRLNGEEIHSARLEDGDVLEVAGTKFTFRAV